MIKKICSSFIDINNEDNKIVIFLKKKMIKCLNINSFCDSCCQNYIGDGFI